MLPIIGGVKIGIFVKICPTFMKHSPPNLGKICISGVQVRDNCEATLTYLAKISNGGRRGWGGVSLMHVHEKLGVPAVLKFTVVGTAGHCASNMHFLLVYPETVIVIN